MRTLWIGCWCVCLFLSCRQNEIGEYTEVPRINFESTSNLGNIPERYVTFTDEDYLNKVMEKTDSVKVELMGKALEEAGICCFKQTDDKEGEQACEMEVPDQMVVGAGIYSFYLKFKVFRPENTGVSCRSLLEFDRQNPEHGFGTGKREGAQVRIITEFRLKPTGWNNYFGVYSDGKYRFMLDFFQGTYASIGNTSENRRLVREAYAEYRLTHVAIVDEQGNEIVFP